MEDIEQRKLIREKLKDHPRRKANFLSHFFFCWELPIFIRGWKTELTDEELYTPLKEYESKQLGDKLEQIWQAEENFRKDPSLLRALITLFGLEFAVSGILYFPVELLITFFQPLFLRKLLDYYTPNQSEVTKQQAYGFAAVLTLLFFIRVLSLHWFILNASVLGMKVRIACSSLIYRQSLRLKESTLKKITVGQTVNLLSNDVIRFDQVLQYLHFLWIGPLELIIGTYYIDITLGHAAIMGVTVLILCLFLQIYISKATSVSRLKIAIKTDYRIRLMNDIICGIETIKMYTWEEPFTKLVETARRLEIKQITTSCYLRLINNTFKIYMSKICVFLSTLVAVLTGWSLTSQYVFALTCIYESFKITVVIYLPLAVIHAAETRISLQRIQEFLLRDREKSTNLITTPKSDKPADCILKSIQDFQKKTAHIYLENVSCKWDQSFTSTVLSNVNFTALCGELVGVIGASGSGKSTLLHVILKEIEIYKGKLSIEGSISYARQQPWIFSASIRQNILFGQSLDLCKYHKVIQVCALQRDLSLLPHGDQTLVGDRGVMLSGGQKARINLARAIYRDADIYLLDDPLSAVDAHVARQIFDDCILKYLKGKCVVLVTHQIQYLQNVDRIYVLNSGEMFDSGKFEELISLKDIFADKNCKNSAQVTDITPIMTYKLQSETKEHRSSGGTDRKNYKNYCLAAGHWSLTCLTLFLFVVAQLSGNLVETFATFWVNLEQGAVYLDADVKKTFSTNNCLYIYTALAVCFMLTCHAASFTFVRYCMNASKKLHNKMLSVIMHETMNFFNHHSSGRILNRFSKDIGSIDEMLPMHLMNAVSVVLTLAGILIMIVALNYWMVIPTLLLLIIITFYGVVFQPTNRNIKRTEGITRSTVLTHLTASIQGLPTIRSCDAQEVLTKEFDNHQDLHSSAFYIFTAAFSAFGFWTDFTAAFYTTLVTFSFFLLDSGTYVGNVGLAITQSTTLLGMIQYGMKTWAELDAQMTSVERVVEYSELCPELDEGVNIPPEPWPTAGKISFQSVSLQYSTDAIPVLKKVSFNVESGEKIGIIGRTGAGKTSLISVLFRLFHFDGVIFIDEVNIKSIPLNTLRSRISIIPQEPVLFLGTLRKNLDPFDEFSDSELWNTLEEFKLKPMISKLPLGMESLVSERGSNFSVGQRQLLCLVRAVLKKSKIIILDEATANIDLKTDALIQTIIKKNFKNCTVLTIAHRLNTIVESDKILVMDGGMVVEYDHPYKLLQNLNGYFYEHVKKNGDKVMTELIKTAKNSY